jgi:hypothetical protein
MLRVEQKRIGPIIETKLNGLKTSWIHPWGYRCSLVRDQILLIKSIVCFLMRMNITLVYLQTAHYRQLCSVLKLI